MTKNEREKTKKRHAKLRHFKLLFFVFSHGVFSLFRLFAWRYFVFSLFRLAFFRYFAFSLGVISSWRRAITPGEKTKERNNEMAQTSHHTNVIYSDGLAIRLHKWSQNYAKINGHFLASCIQIRTSGLLSRFELDRFRVTVVHNLLCQTYSLNN